MKNSLHIFRTTVAGGILFILPFAVLLFVLREVFQLILLLVTPLAELLPIQSIMGFKAPWGFALLTLLAICFAAGILARGPTARRVVSWLENAVLSNLPGYRLMRTVGEEVVGNDPTDTHQSVLIRLDECYMLGFLVEEISDTHVVVNAGRKVRR